MPDLPDADDHGRTRVVMKPDQPVWTGSSGAKTRTHIVNWRGRRACGTQVRHGGHARVLGVWSDVDCVTCQRRVKNMRADHFLRMFDPEFDRLMP